MTAMNMARWALVILCIPCLPGCRPSTGRFDVTGTVTIDGQKAPQGLRVVFTPQETSETAATIGVTNDKGVYVMYAAPGMKGLRPGTYSVAVQKSDDQFSGPPELSGIKIPARYQPGSSTLTCQVGRHVNSFDIEVESK